MDYPEELLPQPGFRYIDVDQLSDLAVLLRRIDTRCGDIELDAFGELPAQHFVGHESLSKLNGLSVSLCGIFRPEHLRLRVAETAQCPQPHLYWEPGEIPCTVEGIDCEEVEEICAAYLPVGGWHRKKFPVRDEVEKEPSNPLSGRIRIVHRPTVSNYWHCELQFFEAELTPITDNKAKWKKKAFSFVYRDACATGAISLTPIECEAIPSSLYKTEN